MALKFVYWWGIQIEKIQVHKSFKRINSRVFLSMRAINFCTSHSLSLWALLFHYIEDILSATHIKSTTTSRNCRVEVKIRWIYAETFALTFWAAFHELEKNKIPKTKPLLWVAFKEPTNDLCNLIMRVLMKSSWKLSNCSTWKLSRITNNPKLRKSDTREANSIKNNIKIPLVVYRKNCCLSCAYNLPIWGKSF